MTNRPPILDNLIQLLTQLPGLGPKSAERIVFALLHQSKEQVAQLTQTLNQLQDSIIKCNICQTFAETNPCPICADQKRNRSVICVVSRPQDITVLEKTGDYQGVYFVLGGVIDPLEGITAERLNIKSLIDRLQQQKIFEIILALNPDLPGETTMLYLTKLLRQFKGLKITRLARGLPVGSDLEYADEVTLSNALKGRREI